MASVSLFEQLTSSVSLSVLAIVSGAILALLLVYTVACRLFFSSSSSKSKDISSNQEKKLNKKKSVKAKKPVVTVSSSSPNTQSEESENDKVALLTSTKKVTPSSKASARDGNAEAKKQSKTSTSNKQQTSGKGDVTTKVNTANLNKKQPVEDVGGSDQEDEGQWVTQSNKQVSNRNRNKGKAEPSSSALPNCNITSGKQPVVPPINEIISSSTNKNEPDIEPSIQYQEPIEIYQLLPKNENRYTTNDNWWKHALNKQTTFSVDDLGEWPEQEQDEQYIVQKKRIVPVKKGNEQQDDNEL